MGEETRYYFFGGRLVALKKGSTLEYVHQDHLTGTFVSSDSAGAVKSTVKYLPFGETRASTGSLGTDKKFTGQRLDGTGLYFYNARYYDPSIGRFISADTVIPSLSNPQVLNRFTYVLNNPLTFDDPTGHCVRGFGAICRGVKRVARAVCPGTCTVGATVSVGVPFVGPHVTILCRIRV